MSLSFLFANLSLDQRWQRLGKLRGSDGWVIMQECRGNVGFKWIEPSFLVKPFYESFFHKQSLLRCIKSNSSKFIKKAKYIKINNH